MAYAISRSLGTKLLVTAVAIVSFVLLYEASTFDLRGAATSGTVDLLGAGTRHLFSATAYCKGTTTTSGVNVRTGIAASDPALLPVGSVVNVTTRSTKYNGVYTIMDTGPKVQGRLLDIYMWSCHEALAFGRQEIEVSVLRLGWNPGNSVPSLVDRLFRRREASREAPAPPAEPPLAPDDEAHLTTGVELPSGDTGADPAAAAASPGVPSPTEVPQTELSAPQQAPVTAAPTPP
jgi:3D (Asp-Asp-Asp) domain-containing protein